MAARDRKISCSAPQVKSARCSRNRWVYNKATLLSRLGDDGTLPVTQTALPRCTATLTRSDAAWQTWKNVEVQQLYWRCCDPAPEGSPLPSADSTTAPKVSTAIVVKSYSEGRLLFTYLLLVVDLHTKNVGTRCCQHAELWRFCRVPG